MSDQQPLRIAHITPTVSHKGGGVAEFLWSFIQEGQRQGLEAQVASLWDPYVVNDTAPQRLAGISIFTGRCVGPRSVGYSPELARYLRDELPQGAVDLVHSHGIRMWPSLEARRLAERRGLPRVVSPHGQFDPWILGYGRLRKRVIHWLYEDRNLRSADCLHATAPIEARLIRKAGIERPIAIVPIGLDAKPYDLAREPAAIEERWPELRRGAPRRLLFLSTIYRKKNLPTLARAWVRLRDKFPDWRLVITGQELDGDRAVAQKILEDAGAMERVTFTGAVPVEVKRQLLANCDLYCLPTFGENWGVAIAEAMAAGLPVITSSTTPWEVLREEKAGWWIDMGLEPLCGALEEAMAKPPEVLRAMGSRGKAVIQERYAWAKVVGQMREVYLWLLGRGTKPDCVVGEREPAPGAGAGAGAGA